MKTELIRCGDYLTIRMNDDKGCELGKILFDEKTKLGEIIAIEVVDLITRKKSIGVGTRLVEEFIEFCRKNYPKEITVYGNVFHQEEQANNLTKQEKFDARIRRNKFWKKFGFVITNNVEAFETIRAKISDLNLIFIRNV